MTSDEAGQYLASHWPMSVAPWLCSCGTLICAPNMQTVINEYVYSVQISVLTTYFAAHQRVVLDALMELVTDPEEGENPPPVEEGC